MPDAVNAHPMASAPSWLCTGMKVWPSSVDSATPWWPPTKIRPGVVGSATSECRSGPTNGPDPPAPPPASPPTAVTTAAAASPPSPHPHPGRRRAADGRLGAFPVERALATGSRGLGRAQDYRSSAPQLRDLAAQGGQLGEHLGGHAGERVRPPRVRGGAGPAS